MEHVILGMAIMLFIGVIFYNLNKIKEPFD